MKKKTGTPDSSHGMWHVSSGWWQLELLEVGHCPCLTAACRSCWTRAGTEGSSSRAGWPRQQVFMCRQMQSNWAKLFSLPQEFIELGHCDGVRSAGEGKLEVSEWKVMKEQSGTKYCFLAPGFSWFYLCAFYWVNGLKVHWKNMSHLNERLVKFLDRMPNPWPGFSLQEPVDTHILSVCLTLAINGPSLSQLCPGKLKKISESNLCFALFCQISRQ